MKKIIYILFLTASMAASGQRSNSPEVVFPMVEQFIAEAHAHRVPVYYKIREIDSIAMAKLPFPLTGFHFKDSTYESITIHEESGRSPRNIEKTFLHEVGHVFGLKHTTDDTKIMSSGYSNWFNYDKNWQKAKTEFFQQLKKTML